MVAFKKQESTPERMQEKNKKRTKRRKQQPKVAMTRKRDVGGREHATERRRSTRERSFEGEAPRKEVFSIASLCSTYSDVVSILRPT